MKRAAGLAFALFVPAAAVAGDRPYVDKTWNFEIAIPPGWSPTPVRPSETDVRLVLSGPRGTFCNVTVGDIPGLASRSQRDLDEMFRRGEFKTGFVDDTQNNHPDAKERRGETLELHGHMAQLTEMAIPQAGGSSTQTLENLPMLTPGRSYSANCGGDANAFETMRPELERILKSVMPVAFRS